MNFIETWSHQLPAAFDQFAELAVDHQDIDLSYGFASAAILWPVRELLEEDEGYDALFDLCGPRANLIFKAMRGWENDRVEACRQLGVTARDNEKLQAALQRLLDAFNGVASFTEALAQKIAERQGGGDVYSLVGQINAAIVNVGGTTTIQSLQLNITPKVEIPSPPQPVRPPEITSFIGREAESAYYLDKLNSTHLALLIGMAGVGKTALAAVLAQQYAPADKIFWHSFHEREGIETIIWKLAGFLAWNGRDELWRMLNMTQQTGGQTQTAENLFDYVIELVRNQNYLLCFDDFQFVDDDPRLNQMVGRLREAVFAGELSIIITSRRIPEFVQSVDFAPLDGLSATDATVLLQRQGLELSERLRAELHLRTGGNAQLLQLAINALLTEDDPDRLIKHLSETDDIERYLLKEVDDRLSGIERDLMGTIALLLGYAGSNGVIEVLSGQGRMRRSLRRLVDRQLLIVSEGEYGKEYMQHSMVQGFYYDHFHLAKRRKLHLEAADFYDREEPDLLKTTLHAERGGDVERAAKLATENVRTFINLGQARPIKSILQNLDDTQFELKKRIKIYLARGRVFDLLGDRDLSKKEYLQAIDELNNCARDFELEILFAEAHLSIAEFFEYENPEEAVSWLNKGQIDQHVQSNQIEADFLILKGILYFRLGEFAHALGYLENGLDKLPPIPSQQKSNALMTMGGIHFSFDENLEKAKNLNEEALLISRRLDDDFQIAQILTNLGLAHFIGGEWKMGVEKFQESQTISTKLGNQQMVATNLLNLGAAFTCMGEDDLALDSLDKCIQISTKINLAMLELIALFRLVDLHLKMEKTDLAKLRLDQLEQKALDLNSHETFPELYLCKAELNLALNQIKVALEATNSALRIASDIKSKTSKGIALRILAQIHEKNKEFEKAEKNFTESISILKEVDPYEASRAKLIKGDAMLNRTTNTEKSFGFSLLKEAQFEFLNFGAKRELLLIEEMLAGGEIRKF